MRRSYWRWAEMNVRSAGADLLVGSAAHMVERIKRCAWHPKNRCVRGAAGLLSQRPGRQARPPVRPHPLPRRAALCPGQAGAQRWNPVLPADRHDDQEGAVLTSYPFGINAADRLGRSGRARGQDQGRSPGELLASIGLSPALLPKKGERKKRAVPCQRARPARPSPASGLALGWSDWSAPVPPNASRSPSSRPSRHPCPAHSARKARRAAPPSRSTSRPP